MPYSTPTAQASHSRVRSSNTYFSDERGPGAFVSLGSLPRRKSAPKKQPVFHFREDDDEPESPDSDDHHEESRTSSSSNFHLTVDTEHLSPSFYPPHLELPPQPAAGSVPFPRSSPSLENDQPIPVPGPYFSPSLSSSPRPSLSRSGSSSVILSNGKPLKSSLKSSSSSPDIPNEVRSLHLRAQSAPSTPSLCKNVHFAEKDGGLESVRVFSRSAKPASLSKPPGDDTETETEQEPPRNGSFPFPRISSGSGAHSPPSYEIDTLIPGATSPVPSRAPPPYANVHLESLQLSAPHTPPVLTGTLVVRNLAFEKHVAVRFTLDDWQTTSEVSARHVLSLPALPTAIAHACAGQTVGDAVAAIAGPQHGQWDRFAFTIRLEDYAHKLHERVVWLVARFTGTGIGEWWDNNNGRNYRVGFKIRRPPLIPARNVTVSAPEPLAIPNAPEKRPEAASSPTAPPPPAVALPSGSPTTSPAAKGRRLSLTNYAAPGVSPPVPSVLITPPMTPESENAELPPSGEAPPAAAAAAVVKPTKPFPRSIIGGMPATWSPSSNGAGGLSPIPGIAVQWPWASSSSSSPPGSRNGSPRSVPGQVDSDSLYQAFVKQWCFAQSPPPTPAALGPGPPGVAGGSGVLVG